MEERRSPEEQLYMDAVTLYLQDWAARTIIGAVEQGLTFVRVQEMVRSWAERLNNESLDVRVRYLHFLAGHSDDRLPLEGPVEDVVFTADAEPDEDDPLAYVVKVNARVKISPSVERVYFSISTKRGPA